MLVLHNLKWDDDTWHTLLECETWKRELEEIFRYLDEIRKKELIFEKFCSDNAMKGKRLKPGICIRLTIMRWKMGKKWMRQPNVECDANKSATLTYHRMTRSTAAATKRWSMKENETNNIRNTAVNRNEG